MKSDPSAQLFTVNFQSSQDRHALQKYKGILTRLLLANPTGIYKKKWSKRGFASNLTSNFVGGVGLGGVGWVGWGGGLVGGVGWGCSGSSGAPRRLLAWNSEAGELLKKKHDSLHRLRLEAYSLIHLVNTIKNVKSNITTGQKGFLCF